MIPKVIHWCWLSGDPLPEMIKKCLDSWSKYMPDYEIKCWTTENFDVESVPYVRDAFAQKKWAFCADYIRAYALYTEGGIYLDSDVQVLKSFDDLLSYDFFSSVEYIPDYVESLNIIEKCLDKEFNRKPEVNFVQGIGIQAAILGASKGNKYMKYCIDYYQELEFKISNKGYDNMEILAPYVYARQAEKIGFKYKNEDQYLEDNFVVFRDDIFCVPEFISNRTYALHLVAHSWFNPTRMQIIYQNIAKVSLFKWIFQKLEKSYITKNIIARLKRLVWLN